MSNRKKSNFPALTAVSTGSSVDFWNNGINYKMSYDDFLAGLGATGSIEQEGPVLAVPVLDIQGSVNKIRNLTGGTGIDIAVDPENGIIISSTNVVPTSQIIVETDSAYTILPADDIIVADGTFIVTLPALTLAVKSVRIKSLIGGGTVTLDGSGGETINGSVSQAITPDSSLTVVPTSSEWVIL